MKFFNLATVMLCGTTLMTACMTSNKTTTSSVTEQNPLLQPYETVYEIPPFEKIRYEHYLPAIDSAIAEHNAEIRALVVNRAMPDFENTILALDNSGLRLSSIMAILDGLEGTDNNDTLEEILRKVQPIITAHYDEISMNQLLFQKVKQVYDQQEKLELTTAQKRLLDKTYKSFVRGGALLSAADQDSLKEVNKALATAELNFNSNLLRETNATEIVVDDKTELDGIPANIVHEAAETAKAHGKEGKWVFTLHEPSRLGVLTNANHRNLRERMYKAYMALCSNGGDTDNGKTINEILRLRQKKARLLGFENFAAYNLDNVMAKNAENVRNLLSQLWTPAIAKVKEEVADMQAYANKQGTDITIEPWDYYYYAEKVKAEKYHLNEEEIRPYLVLDNVVKDGIFYLANQLYDIHFTEMTDAPKYNPEVTVYDVTDADGKHLSVFMTDYYPRAGKAQGAWMSAFKEEYNYEEAGERPIIYNVGNLTKPTKDTPSLLTMDETCTVFHEFGHALQGMLTTAEYRGQNGTSVDRDIVEMPSQINEHWAMEPEILKHYARHYKTGEVIPDSLINKLLAAGTFNQGFMTTELVGAALLDLEWHTAEMGDSDVDVMAFERSIAEKWGLPHEVQFRYRSPYFKHIFGSSHYASGYYTYLWAEVLEADGYETFREHGILDKATAKSYRENILEPGDSEDPMVLFTRFRGKAPSVDALLKNRGLK